MTLVNPASAVQEVAFRLESSEGEERTLVAKPGETKSETFPATVGFTLDVTPASGLQPPGGARPRTIAHEQPENCSTEDGGTAAGDDESAGRGAPAPREVHRLTPTTEARWPEGQRAPSRSGHEKPQRTSAGR
ncbi:hypothetical protein AB0C12_34135 [Actinoplanes sp. NPDC048967]|uniref:hypothetical protein n=1 Tax=Actinoplanes sp. NPDC048967 TaxID=3155269 RepID=UPI0033F377DC